MTTDEQLTRWLAENVLGAEMRGNGDWIKIDGDEQPFDPLTSMDDAMRLLEGYAYQMTYGWAIKPYATVNVRDKENYVDTKGYADTPQRAICYAVAKAHGCPPELIGKGGVRRRMRTPN
jgi:hypothetical protein